MPGYQNSWNGADELEELFRQPMNQGGPSPYRAPMHQGGPPYRAPMHQGGPPYRAPMYLGVPPTYQSGMNYGGSLNRAPMNQGGPSPYRAPTNQGGPPTYHSPMNQGGSSPFSSQMNQGGGHVPFSTPMNQRGPAPYHSQSPFRHPMPIDLQGVQPPNRSPMSHGGQTTYRSPMNMSPMNQGRDSSEQFRNNWGGSPLNTQVHRRGDWSGHTPTSTTPSRASRSGSDSVSSRKRGAPSSDDCGTGPSKIFCDANRSFGDRSFGDRSSGNRSFGDNSASKSNASSIYYDADMMADPWTDMEPTTLPPLSNNRGT